MNQSKEKIQNLMLYVADAVSLVLSYVLAGGIWLVVYKGIRDISLLGDILDGEIDSILISYVFVILFFNMNRDFIKRGKFEELKYVFKMNLMFTMILGVLLFLKGGRGSIPRGVYLLMPAVNMVMMYVFHIFLKFYLLRIRKMGRKSNKVILITTSDRAVEVLKGINYQHNWQMRIEGIILIDSSKKQGDINGIPVVAGYDDMMDYCRTEVVDEILISLAYDRGESLKSLMMELEDMGIVVHLSIRELGEFNEFNKTLGMFGNIPVVTFANTFHDDNKLFLKRIMDIAGALIGLALTGIVAVFVVPVLMIESPGAPIFKQKRVGKNGRYFSIYKFRSMYKDAEARKKELMDKNEMSGLMFKMTDDPRITKVGKFIRKTSIDELPQFFNVLKGDMSLVGTRPPTVDEFKQYEGHHKRRLSMKPGITGLWQVSGRSDIEDFEEVVRLDLQYIDNWSVGMDIKIILKTVGVILFGKGAK